MESRIISNTTANKRKYPENKVSGLSTLSSNTILNFLKRSNTKKQAVENPTVQPQSSHLLVPAEHQLSSTTIYVPITLSTAVPDMVANFLMSNNGNLNKVNYYITFNDPNLLFYQNMAIEQLKARMNTAQQINNPLTSFRL